MLHVHVEWAEDYYVVFNMNYRKQEGCNTNQKIGFCYSQNKGGICEQDEGRRGALFNSG